MKTPDAPTPPTPADPGFGRDIELETTRPTQRPAEADLSSSEAKAEQEPILGPAPDPDVFPA